jgi:ppGpp synthetase/RelA/SpoT-type nucleotidyltranferase
MKHYYMSHYQNLAQRAKELCEEKLRGSSIQAMLTYRAKSPESLQKKLENRNAKRIKHRGHGYENEDEIHEDVIDLAGMRIALYFPNQREVVAGVIEQTFDEVKWKPHPDPTDNDEQHRIKPRKDEEARDGRNVERYCPKFAGYEARHARVRFKDEDARKIKDLKPHNVVEIQVVSVLVHAWAEVEHDITYKSIFDGATRDEIVILDCLNGLIRSSELLLEQLHQLYKARITSAGCRFRHKYELGKFLFERIGESSMSTNVDEARLEILQKFLETVGKNTPQALGFALKELGFEADAGHCPNAKSADPQLNEIVERYKPDKLDQKKLTVLWDWFEKHEKQDQHSIFSFVFKISKMGVLRDLPLELIKLSRCSSPGWSSGEEGI